MERKEFEKLMKDFDRTIEKANKIIEDCDRINQELEYQQKLIDQQIHATVKRIIAEVYKKHNIKLHNSRDICMNPDECYPIFLEIKQRLNELNKCN